MLQLALSSRNLNDKQWELVLPSALHSIRRLLCTSTNATPHKRFFKFQRISTTGQTVPTWLSEPGKIFVKKHVRKNKYDPLVEEAELLHANPQYAHVKLSNGRETTVSIKDLAPAGKQLLSEEENANNEEVRNDGVINESNQDIDFSNLSAEENKKTEHSPRPIRNRRPPIRFGYDEY